MAKGVTVGVGLGMGVKEGVQMGGGRVVMNTGGADFSAAPFASSKRTCPSRSFFPLS